MTTQPPNILQLAQQGDPRAIAALLNRNLQPKGITAKARLKEGCLDIVLDAAHPPNQAVAEFIRNGLLKLNASSIDQVTIYGKQTGEDFPAWSQKFELKSRASSTPFIQQQSHELKGQPEPEQLSPLAQQNTRSSEVAEKSKAQGITFTLSTSDGQIKSIDSAQMLGFFGSGLLLFGVFAPIVSLPGGSLTYIQKEGELGFALLSLAIASIIFLTKKKISWIYGTGLGALLLTVLPFLYYQTKLAEVKSEMSRSLAGNPFRGLADVAMATVQLQWGWAPLFLGSALILTTAYLKQRNLNKQAFIAIGCALLGAFALTLIKPTIASVQYGGEAAKAKQSMAKTYIGSINRLQQSNFILHDKFTTDLSELGSSLQSETKDYKFEITEANEVMAVATAVPKERNLKSYAGAVFLTTTTEGETTTVAIVCESDKATESAPLAPTLNGSSPECPPGSSEPK